MRKTIIDFKQMKMQNEKICLLTAYDYVMAKIFDSLKVDGILVGDSLGMVFAGEEDTLKVTLEDMIYHTRAVKKGIKNALLIADMPFLSYQVSDEQAVKNAGRLIKEGYADAIKIEGGQEFSDTIRKIIKAQIPVMGHIGLNPQSINLMGGFKVQGRDYDVAKRLIEDAVTLEKVGIFALVLECVPYKLAEIITNKISIPTIGIGAGMKCDGQILVYHDMLNIEQLETKKFVKVFEEVGKSIELGVNRYIEAVKTEKFPKEKNSFNIDDDIIKRLS